MDKRSMMKYALAESIKMMGEKLYSKYNDSCCCSCGFREDGQFVYSLCMHTKPFVYKMGDETPYEYVATVVVDPNTGNVTRDYENSRLPQ